VDWGPKKNLQAQGASVEDQGMAVLELTKAEFGCRANGWTEMTDLMVGRIFLTAWKRHGFKIQF